MLRGFSYSFLKLDFFVSSSFCTFYARTFVITHLSVVSSMQGAEPGTQNCLSLLSVLFSAWNRHSPSVPGRLSPAKCLWPPPGSSVPGFWVMLPELLLSYVYSMIKLFCVLTVLEPAMDRGLHERGVGGEIWGHQGKQSQSEDWIPSKHSGS